MKIYLNGKLVEKDQAKVSVFDHGLLYGDGAFEGIRAYNGVVFKLAKSATTITRLASFDGGANGGTLRGGVVLDGSGNLYGTTSSGGANNYGTVFKISPTGTLTSLYSFTGGNDGGNPYAALVQGREDAPGGSTTAPL